MPTDPKELLKIFDKTFPSTLQFLDLLLDSLQIFKIFSSHFQILKFKLSLSNSYFRTLNFKLTFNLEISLSNSNLQILSNANS